MSGVCTGKSAACGRVPFRVGRARWSARSRGSSSPLGLIRLGTRVCLLASASVFRPDLMVDLGAMDGNVCGRFDTDAHLLAVNREHRDLDLIPDHDALLRLACKN